MRAIGRILRENWLWVVLPIILVFGLLVLVAVLGAHAGWIPEMYRKH